MKLYNKDNLICYQDTNDGDKIKYVFNAHAEFTDEGSNQIKISIYRLQGRGHENFFITTIAANTVTDREGFAYGTTVENVVFGFNVGMDMNLQDQTTPPIEHFLYQELADIVITGTPPKGTNVLTLEPGHGFVDPVPVTFSRDYLNIHYIDPDLPQTLGMRFNQFAVIAVAGNDISITPPLPYDLIVARIETSKRVNVNMNLLGTFASPIKFETRPPNGQKWDLTRMLPDMILSTGGDDGKFGNIANGITNGEYFGFEGDLFTEYQVSLFDNGDLRATAFDLTYPSRSGGTGDFALGTRKTIAGQSKSGVAVRLNGANNDKFVKYSQDDLRTLLRYRIKVMGHVVSP